MNIIVTSVGIPTKSRGTWYPQGVARLRERLQQTNPTISFVSWVNDERPPQCPEHNLVDGYDYIGYVAKAFALKTLAFVYKADIGILMDAACYPVKSIEPLVEYIAEKKFYAEPDGFPLGQWSSDRSLRAFGMTRDEAMDVGVWASRCVGMDFRDAGMRTFAHDWADRWPLFAGPHSNTLAGDKKHSYSNEGYCSDDPRCAGHRHDQTILSLLAYQNGFRNFDVPKLSVHSCWAPGPETVIRHGGM